MKHVIKKLLRKTESGARFLHELQMRKSVFQPASGELFLSLDPSGKAIDKTYDAAFDSIFLLLKALRVEGDFFEFGVFQGYSAKFFAEKMNKFSISSSTLHLFDSFQGLPEGEEKDNQAYEYKAGSWVKGSMGVPKGSEEYLRKRLSKILSEKRVHVVKGFFEETLEKYREEKGPLKATLVHLDCDLYSSSKLVLEWLLTHEIMQDGTIVIFDDWMTSRGNPNLGQRKATTDVLQEFPTWTFEPYLSYGAGSLVCIAHDLRVGQEEVVRKEVAADGRV